MAPQRSGANYLIDVDRSADALDLSRTQLAQREVAFDQPPAILSDYDPARRRCALHPRREIDHLADGCVFGVPSGMHRAHDDLAGVDTDAHLYRRAPATPEILPMAMKFVARRERRVQRALRMVLVRHWRAEQSEDPITGGLDDVTFVAMDRLDHEAERGVDNRARLLGIETLHQLGRTLYIG